MMRLLGALSARATALATATLIAAVAVAGIAAVRAVAITAAPEPIAPAGGGTLEEAGHSVDGPAQLSAGAPTADVLANDPFAPDRQLPEYVVEEDLAAASEAPAIPTSVVIRVLGTVVLPDGGGFAIYQLPSEVPKTLRIGERVGELTLITVEPGKAVFQSSSGSRVTLTLVPTGA